MRRFCMKVFFPRLKSLYLSTPEQLQQMEMELLNLPLASRTRLQARLRGYKSELERLKQTVVSA